MKVIVAHPDRQYCNHLLLALAKSDGLKRFYTLFSGNKAAAWSPWLPAGLRQQLRKRAVDPSLMPYIRHFPLLFMADRWLSRDLADRVRFGFDWFDRAVARCLKYSDFDLVITYENANRHTMRMAKHLGKTTVLDLAQIHHSDIAAYGRDFMTPKQWHLEKSIINPRKEEALEHTDYVLVLSSFAADSMRRHGWPTERLFTVPLGVDAVLFPAKKDYSRNGPLRLLFVGTITRRKGLAVLLEVMRCLPPATAELTLIGPMADGRTLLDAYAGCFNYLPFLHHEELAAHYRHADLFVFPSLLDSWAQTVLEAMASGTPAIVSERTGACDAVKQGGGWVVPAADPQILAETILRCAEERDELALMGQHAARIAREYSWERYQQQVMAALREMASHGSLPTP